MGHRRLTTGAATRRRTADDGTPSGECLRAA